ncbi:hypothetical protein [Nocardioides acrostichi]|uniref:Uncharacterized protein n=1 Tax=Nocardioides acrostichi TaxID=2784339 RepID=A0A930Y9A5_9ACTN|nr:hypothetical protein [Nocardioides acrostichi]MBF4163972.1 hypothetical protein [Nocardioides acrostichi]
MSFDVYFQRFRNRDTEPGGGEAMRQVLAPHIVREDPEHSFARVEYGDGEADVYLGPDGMKADHVTGTAPWDLLVQGARAADWVVMPVGCPACLTDEGQRAHMPEGLDDEAVLIASGQDLLAVIRSS